MASFVESGNVKVFPTAFRTENSSGKYTNEENFIGIINSVIDNVHSDPYEDGFIVSVNGTKLSVVIHGYLFTINDYTKFSGSGNLWLAIRVEDGVNNSGALVDYDTGGIALDSGGNFTALKGLTGTSPDIVQPSAGSHRYYLKVLEGGEICARNFMKFKSSSVNYSGSQSISDKFNSLDTKNSDQDAEINRKQYKLVAGTTYLTVNNDNPSGSKISFSKELLDTLDSLNSKGSPTKPIYIGANKKAIASNASVGRWFKSENSATVSQNIYMKDGELLAGYNIWASTNAPNNNDGFSKNGDFWFKYE